MGDTIEETVKSVASGGKNRRTGRTTATTMTTTTAATKAASVLPQTIRKGVLWKLNPNARQRLLNPLGPWKRRWFGEPPPLPSTRAHSPPFEQVCLFFFSHTRAHTRTLNTFSPGC
jgi:hypothetical protein